LIRAILFATVAFGAMVAGGARAGDELGADPAVDRLSVLVPVASRVRTLGDLAGETVCLMTASAEHHALEAVAARLRFDFVRFAFQEEVEMIDAYAVGRCGAMVGDWAALVRLRGPMGINRLTSRLLAEPLADSEAHGPDGR
jgi:hypothetical protein